MPDVELALWFLVWNASLFLLAITVFFPLLELFMWFFGIAAACVHSWYREACRLPRPIAATAGCRRRGHAGLLLVLLHDRELPVDDVLHEVAAVRAFGDRAVEVALLSCGIFGLVLASASLRLAAVLYLWMHF